MAHLTALSMNQTADERARAVQEIYGVSTDSLLDPEGYCFNGAFKVPELDELFLTRAGEVAQRTERMQVSGPRLILLEWGKKHKYAPISAHAKGLLENAYACRLSTKVAASLAGVSFRVVQEYYQHFEMVAWRRGRVSEL